jgi:hypothetical protein
MSLDIRHGRRSRENGQSVVEKYEGFRPKSLDLFLDIVGLTEEQFNEIIDSHVIDPWDPPVEVKIGKKPHDYGLWQSKPGLTPEQSSDIITRFHSQ